MSVSALLHDSDFFSNLIFGSAQSIRNGRMRRCLNVTFPQKLHLIFPGILSFHPFDGLRQCYLIMDDMRCEPGKVRTTRVPLLLSHATYTSPC
jgi:hypothetical protein